MRTEHSDAQIEALLRLLECVHAPHYARFVVGPADTFVEIALSRRQRVASATTAVSVA